MAVTYSRYKFVTVSLPKRFRNGRFNSETATWIQKWLKNSLGLLESSIIDINITVFNAEATGVVIEACTKSPGTPGVQLESGRPAHVCARL